MDVRFRLHYVQLDVYGRGPGLADTGSPGGGVIGRAEACAAVRHRFKRTPRPGSLALGREVRGESVSDYTTGRWRVVAVGSECGVMTVDLR